MSSLPADWKAVVDPKSGKTYYYNKATKETRWTAPDEDPADNSEDDGAHAADTDEEENHGDNGKKPAEHDEEEEEEEHKPQDAAAAKLPVLTVGETSSTDDAPRRGAPAASPASPAPVEHSNPLSKTHERNKSNGEGGHQRNKSNGLDPKNISKGRKLLQDEEEAPLPNDEMVNKFYVKTNEEEDLGDAVYWKKDIDRRNGRTYYWNILTRQTSYARPKGFVDDSAPSPAASPKVMNSEDKEDEPMDLPISASPTTANERRWQNLKQKEDRRNHSRQASEGVSNEDKDAEVDGGKDEPDSDEDPEVEFKSDGVQFQFTHHRKGLLNRVFHVGHSTDRKTMLSFKKNLIRKSLLKDNRSKDAVAVQCFKNIMSYMGDRKSMKAPPAHAKKLIVNALKCGQSMKDEIFLQICKQVTSHPKPSNCMKGWELMVLLLGCIPPSKPMRQYMEVSANQVLEDSEADKQMKDLAKLALERIPKIVERGQRLEAPSTHEIQRDIAGTPYSLKIYTLDGAIKTMDVDCFTMVSEVHAFMCQRLGVSYHEIFALFEVNRHNDERALDDKIRILDVIGGWERIIKENGIKHPEPFRIFFKANLVLKTTYTKVVADEEAIKLLYTQAVYDILNERYPSDIKMVPSIIALHLCAVCGEYKASEHTMEWMEQKCAEMVPPTVLTYYNKKKNAAVKEAAQKVFAKYSKLIGVTSTEARLSFLDYVQDWPLYGAYLINAEQDHNKDLPPTIRLAVNCEGVHLVHPRTRDVIESFNWREIITWGSSSTKFMIQVGDLLTQKKLFFKTNKAEPFMKVIEGYVAERVAHKL